MKGTGYKMADKKSAAARDALDSKRVKKKYLITNTNNFVVTEAYKTGRVNLMFSLANTDNRAVVFTSCSAAEGKSTNSVNMSISLAQTGKKVILIDADLRRPTIHSLLDIVNKNGLSRLLGRFCELDDAINKNVVDGLDVIIAGEIPPNPAELLGSERMADTLKKLHEKYDYIIIDTPPIGIISDALVLSKLCAGICFVTRVGNTSHVDIKKALQQVEIANVKVLGFIKAGCYAKKHFYGKYGKYGRYGRYGGSYGYGGYEYAASQAAANEDREKKSEKPSKNKSDKS